MESPSVRVYHKQQIGHGAYICVQPCNKRRAIHVVHSCMVGPMVTNCTFTFTTQCQWGRLASSGTQVNDGEAWPSATGTPASCWAALLTDRAGICLPLLLEPEAIQESRGNLAEHWGAP